jgi:hypothetical protein
MRKVIAQTNWKPNCKAIVSNGVALFCQKIKIKVKFDSWSKWSKKKIQTIFYFSNNDFKVILPKNIVKLNSWMPSTEKTWECVFYNTSPSRNVQ